MKTDPTTEEPIISKQTESQTSDMTIDDKGSTKSESNALSDMSKITTFASLMSDVPPGTSSKPSIVVRFFLFFL